MLDVQNVTKYYGRKKNKIIGCRNISFHLESGSITSLLGLNGAGKSSIINCISGYYTPNSGDILINGYSIIHTKDLIKNKIGILYEQNPLYESMTVYEFLSFCLNMRGIYKKDFLHKINYAIEFCELEEVKNTSIKNLSKGFKQRTGLAQAIIHDPQFIILDEPTSGLDAVQVKYFWKKILEIANEKTILISTHDLTEAAYLCSNHVIINKGRILANGDTAEIKNKMKSMNCEFLPDTKNNYDILNTAFSFLHNEVNKNEK